MIETSYGGAVTVTQARIFRVSGTSVTVTALPQDCIPLAVHCKNCRKPSRARHGRANRWPQVTTDQRPRG